MVVFVLGDDELWVGEVEWSSESELGRGIAEIRCFVGAAEEVPKRLTGVGLWIVLVLRRRTGVLARVLRDRLKKMVRGDK